MMPVIEMLYHAGLQESFSRLAVINTQPHALLSQLCSVSDCAVLQQSLKSDYDAIKALGLEADVEIHGEFELILLFPYKNKILTLQSMAKAMLSLSENGKIIIACANKHGAKSYEKALQSLSATVVSSSKSKCRVFSARRTATFDESLALEWVQAAQIQYVEAHGLYSQPGLFSWNQADVGSEILLSHIPSLEGKGMDLCCGYGLLSDRLLQRDAQIKAMHLVDAEFYAVTCAEKNTEKWQDKLDYHWLDACQTGLPKSLNWVVCNPPFHTGQEQDVMLGQSIAAQACRSLQRGGDLYLVANRKLPYEHVLQQHLRHFNVLVEAQGFKVIHGVR
ncbi:MAG: methyltransferase [Mariprofundaceae bacterium]